MPENNNEQDTQDKKTCFVAIGFGEKTDPATGRRLDLNKTFENLLKPTFDDLGIDCFRAMEKLHSGSIDEIMYHWLFNADIVVADISTLNPNAIYELGVRHALKPYSTIVISENKLSYPFDLNHISISSYEHLGSDIGFSEVKRFQKGLKELVQTILAKEEDERRDSPIYTYLRGLTPPSFSEMKGIPPAAEMKKDDKMFSDLIARAERAKSEKKYLIAAEYFKECLAIEPNNEFLKQRLVLVTYKAGENKSDEENLQALQDAEELLEEMHPQETTDPETLGLAGSINKRLYDLNDDEKCLNKSMWFYERGFYIKQDYYNGINYAYMLNVKAMQIADRYEAISFYLQASRVREKVVEICENLVKQENFDDRGDREWVYQTLAQAYLGLGRTDEIEKIVPRIDELSKGPFDLDTFYKQNDNLKKLIDDFKAEHSYP